MTIETIFEQIKSWLATISEDLRSLRAETEAMREETKSMHLDTIAMRDEIRRMMEKMNHLIGRIEMVHGVEPAEETEITDSESLEDVSGWKM